jgi:hypothetical protein
MGTINLLRRVWLRQLDLSRDRQWVSDSLAIAGVHVQLAASSPGAWAVHGAGLGKGASQTLTF